VKDLRVNSSSDWSYRREKATVTVAFPLFIFHGNATGLVAFVFSCALAGGRSISSVAIPRVLTGRFCTVDPIRAGSGTLPAKGFFDAKDSDVFVV
jgi:hypothetical protein